MRVYLDGRALAVSDATLGAAIDAALTGAGERMIVEALADGSAVPAADLEAPPDRAPYAEELRFRSADRGSMARVTLFEAADALEHVRRLQSQAAEQVRSGRVEEGMKILGEALEGWASVRSAVEMMLGTGLIRAEGTGEGAEGAAGLYARVMERLAASLREVKRSIAEADWSALGDAVAYDLDEHAEAAGRWLRSRAEADAVIAEQEA